MRGSVCLNGTLVAPEAAQVSVFDRGFLYGDSVFTTVRLRGGRALLLEKHLERLFDSASRVAITLDVTPDELAREVERTIAAAALGDGVIRVTVSRGSAAFSLAPSERGPTTRVVAVMPLPEGLDERRKQGLSLVTRHRHASNVDPRAKTGNYLASIVALAAARAERADDVLFVDSYARLLEATSANLFVLFGRTWCTPPVDVGIFPGMTRSVLLRLPEVRAEERALVREDLHMASAVVLTSSVREVVPVVSIDGTPVGRGLVPQAALDLQDAYIRYVLAVAA